MKLNKFSAVIMALSLAITSVVATPISAKAMTGISATTLKKDLENAGYTTHKSDGKEKDITTKRGNFMLLAGEEVYCQMVFDKAVGCDVALETVTGEKILNETINASDTALTYMADYDCYAGYFKVNNNSDTNLSVKYTLTFTEAVDLIYSINGTGASQTTSTSTSTETEIEEEVESLDKPTVKVKLDHDNSWTIDIEDSELNEVQISVSGKKVYSNEMEEGTNHLSYYEVSEKRGVYTVKVRAISADGKSKSDWVTKYVISAPEDNGFKVNGTTSWTLKWKKVSGAKKYIVYTSNNGGKSYKKYKTTKKNYIVTKTATAYVVAVTKKGGKTIKSAKTLI